MTSPMHGIRVLEVAEHTFVPAASALLSDWGADVIKIEHVTRGDAMRGLARTGLLNLGDGGVHVLLEHSNRGKRSLGLDLSTPEGAAVVARLAAVSDVFLTNKLPTVRASLGIDVDAIRAMNPNIVYVRGSGYGPHGPDADKGGYDVLGYWCRSGLAVGCTVPDVDYVSAQPAPAYGDSIGAMTIAGGIAAALLHRERTGEAPIVDVSLLATGMWAGGAGIALSQQLQIPWRHPPAHPDAIQNPLAAAYRTQDGRWLFISCLQGFQYWPEICGILDLEKLVLDARFATAQSLATHAVEAMHLLQQQFKTATFDEWARRLAHFSGQWAPVQDNLEVADDPQVAANAYLVQAETRQGRSFSLVASPVQFDGQPAQTRRAPEFNEHGDEILTELLGLDWDEVIEMKLRGVVP
jgi:crotonobetainyl-CoA:carnitine CoA-transferase CaiB-like acyl-CoA transferase